MDIQPVSINNPVRVYPDGSHWCAVIGEDLQSGLSGFGKSPEDAIAALFNQDSAMELTPHTVVNFACPHCAHVWVGVIPYPTTGVFDCPKCDRRFSADIDFSPTP
jgi:hypothetical protein